LRNVCGRVGVDGAFGVVRHHLGLRLICKKRRVFAMMSDAMSLEGIPDIDVKPGSVRLMCG
jgi:hypothetical protein